MNPKDVRQRFRHKAYKTIDLAVEFSYMLQPGQQLAFTGEFRKTPRWGHLVEECIRNRPIARDSGSNRMAPMKKSF
jgi:hypothetical protein